MVVMDGIIRINIYSFNFNGNDEVDSNYSGLYEK